VQDAASRSYLQLKAISTELEEGEKLGRRGGSMDHDGYYSIRIDSADFLRSHGV